MERARTHRCAEIARLSVVRQSRRHQFPDVGPLGLHPTHLRNDGVGTYRRLARRAFSNEDQVPSMSLPYHIGNAWFGGMLPLIAAAVVAASGNIYAGLWYPVGVAVVTLLVGSVFMTKDHSIEVR